MNMQELLPIIMSSLSIIASGFVIALLLGKYKEKVDSIEVSVEKLENKIVNVETTLERKITNVEERLSLAIEKVVDKISDLGEKFARLEGRIIGSGSLYNGKSPISLTEKGEGVLIDSGGKEYIDSNLDKFLSAIKKHNPKTAYDVQKLSRDAVSNEEGNDDFMKIKDYTFKEGMELDIIINVLGFYLRDKLLPEFGFNTTTTS